MKEHVKQINLLMFLLNMNFLPIHPVICHPLTDAEVLRWVYRKKKKKPGSIQFLILIFPTYLKMITLILILPVKHRRPAHRTLMFYWSTIWEILAKWNRWEKFPYQASLLCCPCHLLPSSAFKWRLQVITTSTASTTTSILVFRVTVRHIPY